MTTALAVVGLMTAAMWVPYVLARLATNGAWAVFDNPTPHGDDTLPAWAQRAKRAHANAVENLGAFVAVAVAAGWSNPESRWLDLATTAYLLARVVHFASYVAGIPVVRTLAFAAGWAAVTAIGLLAIAGCA